MKSSIHLFYGIIIGILLVACTGSLKEDKAEFKEENVVYADSGDETKKKIKELKQDGWTIIDFEIVRNDDNTYNYSAILVGK